MFGIPGFKAAPYKVITCFDSYARCKMFRVNFLFIGIFEGLLQSKDYSMSAIKIKYIPGILPNPDINRYFILIFSKNVVLILIYVHTYIHTK